MSAQERLQATARDGGSVDVAGAVIDHLDLWTGAVTKKSSSGRGNSGKIELTGIKKLRELILQLAVTGRLVEQNERDEPAATLVSKMLQIRDHLASTEGMRTKANDSVPSSDEYLSIPSSWTWVRLGNMAKFIDYRGKTPTKISTGKRLITAKNIRQGHIDLQPEEFISEADYTIWMTRGFPRKGDLLFTPEAPLGNAAIVDLDEEFALAQRAICFQWHIPETSQFMLLQILASPFQEQLVENATGMTATGIKASKLKEIPVAVPPVEEQHRIVQKVDELMALCDRLEQQTSDQLEAHETLVDTLLGTLTQSENATELADNWARLAAHFDTLFTTEQSIDKLKQTILQLAVMGRLVEQDAGDEPALTLLQSIEDRKTDLVKTGAIKRSKTLPPVSDEERPFKLPIGWECYRLGELVSKLGSGSTPRGGQQAYVETGVPFLRSQNVWNDGLKLDDIVYILEETHARMGNTIVYPKDILLNITGASLGRSTIFPDHIPEANVSQHVTIIRLIEPEMTPFVHLCIQSPLIQRLVWGRQVGMAIEGLSKKVLERFEMPIPPLAEQHRIVQKVDELMALCDQLKERLNRASETRCQLAEAVVEGALN